MNLKQIEQFEIPQKSWVGYRQILFETLASQEDAVNVEKGQEASVMVAGSMEPYQGLLQFYQL